MDIDVLNKLQKEFNQIEHDFKVMKIILIIKEKDYSFFPLIDKMIIQTKEYLRYQNIETFNIIDNNIFELTNILNDLKRSLENDIDGNIYLLLINSTNNYLDQLIKLINDLIKDYSYPMLNNDIHKYYKKIIIDYFIVLKEVVSMELNSQALIKLTNLNINQMLENDLNKEQLQLIYKETKSVMRLVLDNKIETIDLMKKYYLFELTFIILMVD